MMKKTIVLSILTLAACGADQPPAATPVPTATPVPRIAPAAAADMATYETVAREFLQRLDEEAAADALSPLAQQMLDLGVRVVPAYVAIHPECRAYLEAAAGIADTWTALSPEQIERDYHQDGALPEMPAAHCYHMKDVVVHPATALALLAGDEPDREQVKLEIFEVVSHAIAVRTGEGFNSNDGD